MNRPLRVLIVEDSPDDATLLVRQIRKSGYEPVFERVDTAAALSAALANQTWDIVISDYVMPQFSGLEAVKIVHEKDEDIPFIIVSGKIGEDIAVSAMKAGAHDYIMKGSMKRLGATIERELTEAEIRRARKRAEVELLKHREHLEELVTERTAELKIVNEQLQQEIAEHKRTEILLREARDYLNNLLDYTNAPVVVWLPPLKISRFNRAFERLTGYQSGREIMGKDLTILFPKDKQEAALAHIRSVPEQQQIEAEIPVLCKDGTERTLVWHCANVYAPTSHIVVATIAQCMDITELKKLDELKDEFLSFVSHELRTPLTVIVGGLNTVLADRDKLSPEEVQQLLEDSAWEAESMANLLGNLLDLSRAQASRLELHAEPVDVARAITDSVAKVEQRYPGRRFIVDYPRKLVPVTADKLRVERILYNLLENAAKYSPATTEVNVFVRQDSDGITIGVKDKGAGISAADRRRLFQPFERLGLEATQPKAGSGIGLLVCRRLVEAHCGKILVESEPGCGSSFYFTLPLKPGDNKKH